MEHLLCPVYFIISYMIFRVIEHKLWKPWNCYTLCAFPNFILNNQGLFSRYVHILPKSLVKVTSTWIYTYVYVCNLHLIKI